MAGGCSLAIALGSSSSACNGSPFRLSNSGPVASISTSASASSQFLGSYYSWPISFYQRARRHSNCAVLVDAKADAVAVRLKSWRGRRRQSKLQNVHREMVTSVFPLPSSSFPSPLPTGVSSRLCVSSTSNVVESGGGGMSIEEKNAIMEFEGLEEEQEEEQEEDGKLNEESEESAESKEDKPETPGTVLTEASEEEALEDEEQRRRAEIYEPPAWKVGTGKERGAAIASVVALFVSLLERRSADSDGKIIAGTGGVVLERVEEEVEKLRSGGDGNGGNTQQQHLFEILRVVKLLQVDLQLIAASRKSSTLAERVDQAKSHCTQIMNILTVL